MDELNENFDVKERTKFQHEMRFMNVPDKLDEIMIDQKHFTREIYSKYEGQEFSCFNFVEEYFKIWYSLMRAGSEIHEAAELIPSKLWKELPPDFILDKEKVLEEIVDAQKFINQAIQALGFDSVDMYRKHLEKSNVNRKRPKEMDPNNYMTKDEKGNTTVKVWIGEWIKPQAP